MAQNTEGSGLLPCWAGSPPKQTAELAADFEDCLLASSPASLRPLLPAGLPLTGPVTSQGQA